MTDDEAFRDLSAALVLMVEPRFVLPLREKAWAAKDHLYRRLWCCTCPPWLAPDPADWLPERCRMLGKTTQYDVGWEQCRLDAGHSGLHGDSGWPFMFIKGCVQEPTLPYFLTRHLPMCDT